MLGGTCIRCRADWRSCVEIGYSGCSPVDGFRVCTCMSAIGINAKCRPHRAMSEFGGEAENICSRRVFRILTHMYGPAVRCKSFVDLVVSGLASMYPASDWSIAPGHHGYQRAWVLIRELQGVRFSPFRLDEQRPQGGLCARKELKLVLLSLLEAEQAQPSAADSP
jgi:hypothetical protein